MIPHGELELMRAGSKGHPRHLVPVIAFRRIYHTESGYKVFFQKSFPVQIRQHILYFVHTEEHPRHLVPAIVFGPAFLRNIVLNSRTTTLQKREAVPRRTRV